MDEVLERDSPDTVMIICLTEDQLRIQEFIRCVAAEKVTPQAAEIDRTAEYPQDMLDQGAGWGIERGQQWKPWGLASISRTCRSGDNSRPSAAP
jgi:hypothetical protein